MAIDHDAPYAALASRLQTKCGPLLGRPVFRRMISFDQLAQGEHAAMAVLCFGQTSRSEPGAAPVWTLTATVLIFARADADPQSSAEPILNSLIAAVESALERQSDELAAGPGMRFQHWTNLGGAVTWAMPTVVEMDDGSQGNEGIAAVRVEMLPKPA